jgi:hypothetical protein
VLKLKAASQIARMWRFSLLRIAGGLANGGATLLQKCFRDMTSRPRGGALHTLAVRAPRGSSVEPELSPRTMLRTVHLRSAMLSDSIPERSRCNRGRAVTP